MYSDGFHNRLIFFSTPFLSDFDAFGKSCWEWCKIWVTLWHHHLLGEEDTEWLKQFRDYNLSNQDVKALVFVRQAGSINNFIYRVANGVDTLDASRKLIRLREMGLLESNGKGRSTYYTLASQFLSGELEAANLESSTDKQSLSGELEAANLESSTDKQGSSAFESLQLELEMSSDGVPQTLQEKIQALGKRSPSPEEVKGVIVELCALKPQSSNELATLRAHLTVGGVEMEG